jgi:hypothetical protein
LFSILRRTHGKLTEEDIASYKKAAEGTVKLWGEFGMNYTPSFHYVHKEAIRLLEKHGGFGDLTEDHLEQSHQTMDKIHRRLGRLGFGAKRAMAISKLVRMSKNPELVKIMDQVRANRKRKFRAPTKAAQKKLQPRE